MSTESITTTTTLCDRCGVTLGLDSRGWVRTAFDGAGKEMDFCPACVCALQVALKVTR